MGSATKYTDDFKRNAVARFRAAAGSRTFASMAVELGVNHETLRGWVRQAQSDEVHRDVAGAQADQVELQRLRVRVAELEKERETLRRAAQYFARELPA